MFPSLVFLLVLSSVTQAEQSLSADLVMERGSSHLGIPPLPPPPPSVKLLSAALVMERGSSHLGISSSVVPPLPQPPPSVKGNNGMLLQVLHDKMKNQDKIIDMLLKRIQQLETTVDEQQAAITSHSTNITGLENKTADQDEQLNDHVNKIAAHASNIASNREQIIGHEERIVNQELELREQGKLVAVQGTSIESNRNNITRVDAKQSEQEELLQKHNIQITGHETRITKNTNNIAGLENKTRDQSKKLNDHIKQTTGHGSNIASISKQIAKHESLIAKQRKDLQDQGKLVAEQGTSIESNKNEITRIDAKQREQGELLPKHSNQIADHDTRIAKNINNIAGHETRIVKQETQLNAHRTQMARHEQKIVSNTNRISVVERNIARHDQRFTDQQRALAASGRQQRTYCDGQVAAAEQRLNRKGSEAYFTVVANGIQSHSKMGATIKFPVTRVNVTPPGSKGGWNSRTHEYVCPVNGDYLFIVSLFNEVGDEYQCAARLWHGGKILASLNNEQKIGHFTSSMHGIASCRAGDRVRVGTFHRHYCKLFDSRSHLNQFSGVLLKRW